MNFRCPTICYGRREDQTTGNKDYYDVLSNSDDFPDDAKAVFRERLCKSIQWSGGSDVAPGARYTDCFLLWKISPTRILIARLIDAGYDSRKRPHSMSIDAGLVEIEKIEIPLEEFLSRAVMTPDWPDGTITEKRIDSSREAMIRQFLDSDAESFLIASHPYFVSNAISMVSSPETPHVVRAIKTTPPEDHKPSRSDNKTSNPESVQKNMGRDLHNRASRILIFFLLLATVWGVFATAQWRNESSVSKKHEKNYQTSDPDRGRINKVRELNEKLGEVMENEVKVRKENDQLRQSLTTIIELSKEALGTGVENNDVVDDNKIAEVENHIVLLRFDVKVWRKKISFQFQAVLSSNKP